MYNSRRRIFPAKSGEYSRRRAENIPAKQAEFFKSGEYSHTGEKQGTKRGFSGDKKGKDFPIKTGQFYSLTHKKVRKIDFFDKKRSKNAKNSEKDKKRQKAVNYPAKTGGKKLKIYDFFPKYYKMYSKIWKNSL